MINLFYQNCFDDRKKILDISQNVSALHAGGAMSSIEIINFIYFYLMKKKDKKFYDKFIMSKGHSCIAQYVILLKLGILKKKDLESYCKKNGILGCHPDYGVPGIEASTGSLGHGMGLACGIAHANKIKKNNKKVYVILSDGELQEGSTWECMMMAANLNLDNLIVFLDHNGSQSFGNTRETHPKFYPINKKVLAFNWDCKTINGHKFSDFKNISKKIYKNDNKPKFIICNTVKGKGISFMENQPIWHYRSPNKNEYEVACKELKFIKS